MLQIQTPPSCSDPEGAPRVIALTRENLPSPRHCLHPRRVLSSGTGKPIRVPCGRPRCSRECRDKWAKKLASCLCRSFLELPPTHEVRITVYGMITDQELSQANGSFFRRLRYRLGTEGSECEYLAVNEWSEGHRHMHILVRTCFALTSPMIRALWAKTLPSLPFTHHCAGVRNPAAIARYVVKHVKDDSKKELAPRSFKGRVYSYSRGFFTETLADLWKEQVAEWYPARKRSSERIDT